MQESSTALGAMIRGRFTQTSSERRFLELQWLESLRQYKGLYDPTEEAVMDTKQSRSYVRVTRIKTDSATARLMDLVFPAGSEENWEIAPTPLPEISLNPVLLDQMSVALGRPLSHEEVKLAMNAQAQASARAMQQTIRDQLVDARYRRLMKQVLHSGNLLGTGILKGPLVNSAPVTTWRPDPQGEWGRASVVVNRPHIEFVPVWEIYPDFTATDFQDARWVIQRVVTAKHTLMEWADREDFYGEVIREYLRTQPETDVTPLHWEIELRRLGLNLAIASPKYKRYEVLEFWGILDVAELEPLGIVPPEMAGDTTNEVWANVFVLGNQVIKAELQPIQGVDLPYYAYYWGKDETSIFGFGIPSIMRDDQKSLNACVRAMQDNAAICAGPQFEVNTDLIHPDTDPRDLGPRKVWLRQGIGAESQYPALRAVDPPSHTPEYLSMAQFFMNNIHEATIPSYMHGEATSKGSVGRTVGGLSILMTAAQITFKDQLFRIDDDIIRPMIRAMYQWNMNFNPDPAIKGDMKVVVKGTSSLVAREIRAQNLDQFAQSTMNAYDAPYVDRQALLQRRAEVLELGDGVVLSKDQALLRNVLTPLMSAGANENQPNPPAGSDAGGLGGLEGDVAGDQEDDSQFPQPAFGTTPS